MWFPRLSAAFPPILPLDHQASESNTSGKQATRATYKQSQNTSPPLSGAGVRGRCPRPGRGQPGSGAQATWRGEAHCHWGSAAAPHCKMLGPHGATRSSPSPLAFPSWSRGESGSRNCCAHGASLGPTQPTQPEQGPPQT